MGDEKQANEEINVIDLFQDQANFESLFCGQHNAMVQFLRKVLKDKSVDAQADAMAKLNEMMAGLLNQIGDGGYTVGSSLGSAMKDSVVAYKGNEKVLVKFIMDPLPVDCKQRTFISKELKGSLRQKLFAALYKLQPPQNEEA